MDREMMNEVLLHYDALLRAIGEIGTHAAFLEEEWEKVDPDFSDLFMGEGVVPAGLRFLADARETANFLGGARHQIDDMMRFLPYLEKYAQLKEWRAMAERPEMRLVSLLEKAGAEKSDRLARLAGEGMESAPARYRALAHELTQMAARPEEFRRFLAGGGKATGSDQAIPQPEEMERVRIGTLRAGDEIELGAWPQTADGGDRTPITWQVLSVKDGQATLISQYALFAMPYHEETSSRTWADCSLRQYLNGDFYRQAFSKAEQMALLEENVDNPDNPDYGTDGGNATFDSVYLPGISEMEEYSRQAIVRQTRPTAYARSRVTEDEWNANSPCWLRSPGYTALRAAVIDLKGRISTKGLPVAQRNVYVRPVIRVATGEEN